MTTTAPLDDEHRHDLRRLIDTIGEGQVLRQLGVSRHTLGRALAGLPVYSVTQRAIALGLSALAASKAKVST